MQVSKNGLFPNQEKDRFLNYLMIMTGHFALLSTSRDTEPMRRLFHVLRPRLPMMIRSAFV